MPLPPLGTDRSIAERTMGGYRSTLQLKKNFALT